MLLEEFDETLKSKIQTEEDLENILPFFAEDISTCRIHAKDLCNLYEVVYVSSINPRYLSIIHEYAKKYLAQVGPIMDVEYLYLLEMLYFYHTDSSSEVLKFANRIISMEDCRISKTYAYSFSILVLTRMGLYKDAIPYIEEVDIYLRNCPVSMGEKFHVLTLEMDYYASAKLARKYEATKKKVDSLLDSIQYTSSYYLAKQFTDVHALFGSYCLRQSHPISKEEIIERVKSCYEIGTKNYNFSENLSRIVVPVLRYVKNLIPIPIHVIKIMNIIQHSVNINERVALYQFLIEDVKISASEYPNIYEKYYKELAVYYEQVQANRREEAETEVMNFSLEKKFEDISAQYQKDSLTGCYNRVFLSQIEDTIMEQGDHVLYLDLNDFKQINDTFGHAAGDEQLTTFADILLDEFKNDIVIRLGGDEFVIYARGVAEDILAKVEETRIRFLHKHMLKNEHGFSIGMIAPCGMPLHKAIDLADALMYDCKHKDLDVIYKEV